MDLVVINTWPDGTDGRFVAESGQSVGVETRLIVDQGLLSLWFHQNYTKDDDEISENYCIIFASYHFGSIACLPLTNMQHTPVSVDFCLQKCILVMINV
jgi:hypothetical protein